MMGGFGVLIGRRRRMGEGQQCTTSGRRVGEDVEGPDSKRLYGILKPNTKLQKNTVVSGSGGEGELEKRLMAPVDESQNPDVCKWE